MKPKKCPHRAGEGETKIRQRRLSPAPSPVKSSLVLLFLQQPNFTHFRVAFPHLSPKRPASPEPNQNLNSNPTMQRQQNPHDDGINNGCGHVIAPQENGGKP
jgi:hypothetical protein